MFCIYCCGSFTDYVLGLPRSWFQQPHTKHINNIYSWSQFHGYLWFFCTMKLRIFIKSLRQHEHIDYMKFETWTAPNQNDYKGE